MFEPYHTNIKMIQIPHLVPDPHPNLSHRRPRHSTTLTWQSLGMPRHHKKCSYHSQSNLSNQNFDYPNTSLSGTPAQSMANINTIRLFKPWIIRMLFPTTSQFGQMTVVIDLCCQCAFIGVFYNAHTESSHSSHYHCIHTCTRAKSGGIPPSVISANVL